MSHDPHHEPEPRDTMKSRAKWIFIGFAVIAGYFLITEHRAHLYGWLASYGIWLLLLACPLMHLFMPHGHGGGREHSSHSDPQEKQK